MSVLPGGQPLHRVLPDLDELLEDPHVYLSEAPLAFGPRRMYGLAALFAVPGVALLLSCVLQGRPDGERLAMGVGFLLGAGVWFGWSLLMRGHEIVFHPDGVEIIYRDTSVWAPWALFHVEGRQFVPDSDSPRAGLTVPIDPKMVPHVQLRRGGMVVAWGLQVQGPQWFFTGRDEVALPARYEVTAQDVGELLLVLGHRLGADPPRTVPPPEAEAAPLEEKAPPDPAGWITLPLTRLHLPNCCSRCGGPRDDTLRVQVRARGDWLLGLFLGGLRGVELPVPVCEACRDYIVQRGRNGGSLGLVVGAALGTALGVGLGVWYGEGRDLALWLGALLGFFPGAFAGSLLGLTLSRKMPVRVRGYSPSRGLVSVRFENPAIAARVLEGLRQAQQPAEEPPRES
jgi:hypothetical protein